MTFPNAVQIKLKYAIERELETNRAIYRKWVSFLPKLQVCRRDLDDFKNKNLNEIKNDIESHIVSKGVKNYKVDEVNISMIKDHSYTSGDIWNFGDVLYAGPIGIPFLIPMGMMALGGEGLNKVKRWFRPEIHFHIRLKNSRPQTFNVARGETSMGHFIFSN